jgi:hypothetical protein
MSRKYSMTGALVKLLRSECAGSVGIVTRPITEENIGHVLIYGGGYLLGLEASIEDVEPAGQDCEGFAQLAYNLIKLGSHVSEQKLIVYRS